MFDREYVWGVCCSGVVLLVLVLFLPVVAFGVPVKVFIDVPGGPAGFNVSSGIDWDDVYDVVTYPDEKWTWYGDNSGSGWNLGGIATVGYVSITVTAANPLNPNPEIELGFAATAGASATTLTIYSDALNLGSGLINVQAYAYADMRIITSPGKSITGGYDTEAYRALYNGTSEFAQLIDTPINSPSSRSDNFGWQGISGVVSSMQPEWVFSLSPNAPVSATSRYEILGDVVPEPASIVLLGLGTLGLLKRWRK